MFANADISWPGGKAKAGDDVDGRTIPDALREKWLRCGVIVEKKGQIGAALTGDIGEREAALAKKQAERLALISKAGGTTDA